MTRFRYISDILLNFIGSPFASRWNDIHSSHMFTFCLSWVSELEVNPFGRLHFRKSFLSKWPKAPVRLIMRSLNWNADQINSHSTVYVCKWHIEAPPMAVGHNIDISHALAFLWKCVAWEVRALSLLFCSKRCQHIAADLQGKMSIKWACEIHDLHHTQLGLCGNCRKWKIDFNWGTQTGGPNSPNMARNKSDDNSQCTRILSEQFVELPWRYLLIFRWTSRKPISIGS